MLRTIPVIGLLPLLLLASPASALTKAEKLETCTFGADHPKLEGAKRKTFIAKCMANRNDKRGAMKLPSKKPVAKKRRHGEEADGRQAGGYPLPPPAPAAPEQ